jgi:hypothetical protein
MIAGGHPVARFPNPRNDPPTPSPGVRKKNRAGNSVAASEKLGHESIETTRDAYTVFDTNDLRAALLSSGKPPTMVHARWQ